MKSIAWLVTAIFLIVGCGERGANDTAQRPTYVVTIPPLRMIVEEIVGDRGDVICLLGPGGSPHTFDPTVADAKATANATLLISVADSLDGWAAKLPAKRRVEVLDLVPESMRVDFPEEDEHEHDHAHDHEHHGFDSHFWTNPLAVAEVTIQLSSLLAEADPAGAEIYRENSERFRIDCTELDGEIAGILGPHEGEAVLLMHPSFLYLIDRYGLEYVASVEDSPGKEITPRQIDALVDSIREKKVRAIFSEPQLPKRPAEILSEAAGVPVRILDPLGGSPERNDYRTLMLYNANLLSDAFSTQPPSP